MDRLTAWDLGDAELRFSLHSRTLLRFIQRPFILLAVKVLFIGDVVGEPGRRAVRQLLPGLRLRFDFECVIANGENSAHGAGITASTAQELLNAGVDVITSGDHVWDQKESATLLEQEPRCLRPANYPAGVPGQGSFLVQRPGRRPLAVLNLQGRTFIAAHENPFAVARQQVERLRQSTPLILIDFHAEATSEKVAMGWLLDGQVSAVIGTHTHVQTADERILPQGTACLTDAGCTGGQGGVLGREWAPVVHRYLTGLPQRFGICNVDVQLQGCLVEIDDDTGRAISIQRIVERLHS